MESVCKELDIEFSELITGYRVRHNEDGVFVDIYLYDSLSSGAGYAISVQSTIQKILKQTRTLLTNCTCDNSCYKCLKHYRNQNVHSMLDRKAALDLLNWGEYGIRADAIAYQEQKKLLYPMHHILQSFGADLNYRNGTCWINGHRNRKQLIVYPSMWSKPTLSNTICVSDAILKYAKPYALTEITKNLL